MLILHQSLTHENATDLMMTLEQFHRYMGITVDDFVHLPQETSRVDMRFLSRFRRFVKKSGKNKETEALLENTNKAQQNLRSPKSILLLI